MKKLLILLAAVCCALGLTACAEPPSRHIHEYTSKVTEPACTERGFTTYNCECGKSYISDYTAPLGHNYVDKVCTRCGWKEHEHNYETTVIQPTCTEQGYTYGKCSTCAANYKAYFVDPLGHDFDNGCCKRCGFFDAGEHVHSYETVEVKPTCTSKGYTTYTCTECGQSYTDNYVDMLEHNFVDGNCTYCNKSQNTEGISYIIIGDYAVCNSYKPLSDEGKEIVIASSYNGKPVTIIGANAFKNRISIEKVIIPDSVTKIGDGAFSGCASLSEVEIPESVTSIGDEAFSSCDSLLEFVIPNSVISMGEKAFNACSGLNSIVISDGVTSISDSAFYYCTSLTSIDIPDSVTSIGYYAFYYCTSLTNITLPDSVTSISNYAFNGCTSLTNITLPDSVTSIGDSAFGRCSLLTNITLPDSVTDIGDSVFNNCASLASITIPHGVTDIGSYAFSYCTSLTNITIPDSVTDIGDSAFYNCASLTDITIPDSVTSIRYNAFRECRNLQKITLSANLGKLERYAFSSCPKLNDIYFNGTKERWYVLSDKTMLYLHVGCTIHCTDGDVIVYAEEEPMYGVAVDDVEALPTDAKGE